MAGVIASAPWYHGELKREEAERRIEEAKALNPAYGVFLVRKSSKSPNDYVLSCVPAAAAASEIKHLIIAVTGDEQVRLRANSVDEIASIA